MEQNLATSFIKPLPEHLINKIKAGEVLSSPYFMVKELLENAIDAGATEISLKINDAGLGFFRIEDNGKGMSKEDLPLSIERHYTSKLSRFDELWDLPTYGFRGEALASIASVSHLVIYSKILKNLQGNRLEVNFGKKENLSSSDGLIQNQGTIILVQRLFENTPVRLNFLNNRKQEKQKLIRMLHALFSIYYSIQFKLEMDEQSFPIYRPKKTLPERLADVKDLDLQEIITHETSYDSLELKFYYFLQPKKIPAGEIIFNGRWLQMGKWAALIQKKLPAHYHYLLIIELPKSQVDVNVHPNKTELHTLSSPKIISLLLSMLTKIFPSQDSTPFREVKSAEHKQINSPEFLSINEEFAIGKISELSSLYYLIHLPQLKKTLCSLFLSFHPKESDIIPLLVSSSLLLSEKFLPNLDHKIAELESLGFSIHQFEEKWHAQTQKGLQLRSIPKVFFSHSLTNWGHFLEDIFQNDDFPEALLNSRLFQNMEFPLLLEMVTYLGGQKILDPLDLNQAIKPINSNVLAMWMKEHYAGPKT